MNEKKLSWVGGCPDSTHQQLLNAVGINQGSIVSLKHVTPLMAAAFAILYPHTRFTEHLHGTKSGDFAPQTRGAMQRVRNLVVRLFGGMQVFLFLSVCAIWGRPDIFLYGATPILVSLALGRAGRISATSEGVGVSSGPEGPCPPGGQCTSPDFSSGTSGLGA